MYRLLLVIRIPDGQLKLEDLLFKIDRDTF